MKLSVASLVLFASSVATVSAIDDTLPCYKVSKVDDEGNTKTIFTNDPAKHYEYLLDLGYVDDGEVSPDNCQTCGLAPPCDVKTDGRVVECDAEVDEHFDAEDNLIAVYTTRECEEEYPKIDVCRIKVRHNNHGAVASWETTQKSVEPIIQRRNLRVHRRITEDDDNVEIIPLPCEEVACIFKCPELPGFTLAEDVCADTDAEGECTYTDDSAGQKDPKPDDEDETCLEYCVLTKRIDDETDEYEKKCLTEAEELACNADSFCDYVNESLCVCAENGVAGGLCGQGEVCVVKEKPNDNFEYECELPAQDDEDNGPEVACVTMREQTDGGEIIITYKQMLLADVDQNTRHSDFKKKECMEISNALCKQKSHMETTGNENEYHCVS